MSFSLTLFDDLFDGQSEFETIIGSVCDQVFNSFEPLLDPATDLYESNAEYRIVMDLPGINKNSIKIELDRSSLEVRLTDEGKLDKLKTFLHLKEKALGLLVRKVNFPSNIQPNKASVTFDDGVLSITIPKAENNSKISLPIT